MWCFRYVPKTGVNSQLKLHSQLEILIIHSKRRWSEIPEMVEAVSEQGRLTVWGKCQHIGPWASLPAEPFARLHHKGYRLCHLQLDQTMPSSPLTLPTYLYTPPSPSVFLSLYLSLCFSSNADMFFLRPEFPNPCEMYASQFCFSPSLLNSCTLKINHFNVLMISDTQFELILSYQSHLFWTEFESTMTKLNINDTQRHK